MGVDLSLIPIQQGGGGDLHIHPAPMNMYYFSTYAHVLHTRFQITTWSFPHDHHYGYSGVDIYGVGPEML